MYSLVGSLPTSSELSAGPTISCHAVTETMEQSRKHSFNSLQVSGGGHLEGYSKSPALGVQFHGKGKGLFFLRPDSGALIYLLFTLHVGKV